MEKIAIIGLACLFPDAQTPTAFWQNLIDQKDSTSLLTRQDLDGLDPQTFLATDGTAPDQAYSLRGGYIRDFNFEATGYHLPADILSTLDPSVQGSLYTAKQALQDSGYLHRAANCGLILGNLAFPTRSSHQLFAPIYQGTIEPTIRKLLQQHPVKPDPLSPPPVSPDNAMTFGLPSMIVAQALGLTGTSFSLDAACASSLYAVELACGYLRSHKADLMLAGAVSYAEPLFTRMLFSGVQAYPKNGISRPLDSTSRGLTPSDGVGMVVLKRYADAVRDGDRIYATIRGVGLSNDGCGKHLLSPNQRGQQLAFERAYAQAGISPGEIDYLECHATGTLLGDTTELASIETFWQDQPAPLVGTAKSNVGHLLTAAGMVGLIKVILAMSKDLIPATIHVGDPVRSPNQVISAKQIVTHPTPWPRRASVKRGAISAFGFGGTNAHLILEQPLSAEQALPKATEDSSISGEHPPLQPLAIIGMDAVFGTYDGLDALERSLYEGQQSFIPLPADRWRGIDKQTDLLQAYGFEMGEAPKGAYIKSFDIDTLRYKIPPNEVNSLNPQQLLMLKVADRALQDAHLQPGGNVAVIVAMETEPRVHQLQQRWRLPSQLEPRLAQLALTTDQQAQLAALLKDSLHPSAEMGDYIGHISNITASRISALWDFTGPTFTLSAGENSTFKALEVAQLLLSAKAVDAVVVGAVDLAGGAESVLLKQALARVNTGKATLSYDRAADGWAVGEGAGAVVIKPLEAAKESCDRSYAILDAIALVQTALDQAAIQPVDTTSPLGQSHFASAPSSEKVTQACQQAFKIAGIDATKIDYLEVCGSGLPQTDNAEIKGLMRAYSSPESPLSCAVGSIKANIGHTQVAAGMASLIKTALCLYHRYIPAVPQWGEPKQLNQWKNSSFYVASQSMPWLLDATKTHRTAAINSIGIDNTCAHLVLSEAPNRTVRQSQYLTQMPLRLIPIAAEDSAALLEQLNQVQKMLTDKPVAEVVRQAFIRFQQQTATPYAVAILGCTPTDFQTEIQRALTGIPKAFETQAEWKSPAGSYFNARPLGPQTKIAFIYPGAFGAYVGLGRTRFRLFPKIYDDPILKILNSYTATTEKYLFPRSLKKLSLRQIEAIERQLMDNPIALLEAEIACATLSTTILKDYFKLTPQFVFGYSLGELSMMVAQGVWQDFVQGLDAFRTSSLFGDRLSGPKNAVRDYWQQPSSSTANNYPDPSHLDTSDPDSFWNTYVLMAPAAEVKTVLETESRVYLTQINTPQEVVIAGDAQGCQRVVKALNCSAFRAPFNHLIHCPPVQSEYNELVKLNTLPSQNCSNVTFYSAADYKPLALESQSIGHSIAKNLCQQFDFPRLVNQIYGQGARIFIEVGAGSTCSRWVGEILKQQDHLVESFDKRGMDDHVATLRLMAKLLSHRIPVDLSCLYEPIAAQPPSAAKTVARTITLGGDPIRETALTQGQKIDFQPTDLQSAVKAAQPYVSPPLQATVGPCYQKIYTHNRKITQTHAAFLRARQASLKQMGQSIQLQIELSRQVLTSAAPDEPSFPIEPPAAHRS